MSADTAKATPEMMGNQRGLVGSIRAGSRATEKPGRRSLEGDKGRPAKQ
jgi:hypothetical protein